MLRRLAGSPMKGENYFKAQISAGGVGPDLPTMRDPDNLCYFREEVGGLCMGGYERNPAPWSLDGVPADFNGKLLAPDWPRFEEIMAGAVRRVPAIAEAVRKLKLKEVVLDGETGLLVPMAERPGVDGPADRPRHPGGPSALAATRRTRTPR